MRRLCCCLLFLTACIGTSQVTPPRACPACPEPECKETVHPDKLASNCPQVAPPPAAKNWHCLVVTGSKEGPIGLCNASAAGCQRVRNRVRAERKHLTPSPCTTRLTAYCYEVTLDNTWHRLCGPTRKDCEESLALDRAESSSEPEEFGVCQLMRNIDPLKATARDAIVTP